MPRISSNMQSNGWTQVVFEPSDGKSHDLFLTETYGGQLELYAAGDVYLGPEDIDALIEILSHYRELGILEEV